jgi:hypothetical protein
MERSAECFVIEGGLGSWRIGDEQGVHELPWIEAVPSGGFQQTGKDTLGDQSAFRPGSEPDLAEDHEIPQGLLDMVACGRDPWVPEEREDGHKS